MAAVVARAMITRHRTQDKVRKGIGRPKILRPGLVDVVAAGGLGWILLLCAGPASFLFMARCSVRHVFCHAYAA